MLNCPCLLRCTGVIVRPWIPWPLCETWLQVTSPTQCCVCWVAKAVVFVCACMRVCACTHVCVHDCVNYDIYHICINITNDLHTIFIVV